MSRVTPVTWVSWVETYSQAGCRREEPAEQIVVVHLVGVPDLSVAVASCCSPYDQHRSCEVLGNSEVPGGRWHTRAMIKCTLMAHMSVVNNFKAFKLFFNHLPNHRGDVVVGWDGHTCNSSNIVQASKLWPNPSHFQRFKRPAVFLQIRRSTKIFLRYKKIINIFSDSFKQMSYFVFVCHGSADDSA